MDGFGCGIKTHWQLLRTTGDAKSLKQQHEAFYFKNEANDLCNVHKIMHITPQDCRVWAFQLLVSVQEPRLYHFSPPSQVLSTFFPAEKL